MIDDDVQHPEITPAHITTGAEMTVMPNFSLSQFVDAATLKARVEFRVKAGGQPIASMATPDGTADGDITITYLGARGDLHDYEALCILPSDVTATLSPSVDPYTGVIEQAGVGDLKVWSDTLDDMVLGYFNVSIEAGVTL